MRVRKLLRFLLAAGGCVGCANVALADAAAGKAMFNDICAQCHESADFEGENAAELTATIKKISAGRMKHEKALEFTDQQAIDVAEYMVSGGK